MAEGVGDGELDDTEEAGVFKWEIGTDQCGVYSCHYTLVWVAGGTRWND